MRRRLTRTGVVISVCTAFMLALAIGTAGPALAMQSSGLEQGGVVTPAPSPSGNYLDPVTRLVYQYDAGTGLLVATGAYGQLTDYIVIDVYDTGQRPDPRTLSTATCPSPGYCLKWRIAIVRLPGAPAFSVQIDNNDQCLIDQQRQPRHWYFPERTGTLLDDRTYPYDCSYGTSTAEVYLDGHLVASDSLTQ